MNSISSLPKRTGARVAGASLDEGAGSNGPKQGTGAVCIVVGEEGLAAGWIQVRRGAHGEENEFYKTQRRKGRESRPGDAAPRDQGAEGAFGHRSKMVV